MLDSMRDIINVVPDYSKANLVRIGEDQSKEMYASLNATANGHRRCSF